MCYLLIARHTEEFCCQSSRTHDGTKNSVTTLACVFKVVEVASATISVIVFLLSFWEVLKIDNSIILQLGYKLTILDSGVMDALKLVA